MPTKTAVATGSRVTYHVVRLRLSRICFAKRLTNRLSNATIGAMMHCEHCGEELKVGAVVVCGGADAWFHPACWEVPEDGPACDCCGRESVDLLFGECADCHKNSQSKAEC